MVRLADKERVFQLLIHRLNLVRDMSLAQFEAWFGPLENVVWDAPPSAVDWGEDFWMGFRTFMLQEYNPRMPYSCQIRFPEYVEAYMELPVHFSKESLKRPKHSVNNAGGGHLYPVFIKPVSVEYWYECCWHQGWRFLKGWKVHESWLIFRSHERVRI